jgi:hypothetical protein
VSKVIVNREHVPSKKVVIVRAPDGTPIGRWAKDEHSVENVLGNLTKDGDMPGGHKELGCVLGRDPKRSYPDLATYSTIELQGVGREKLWQGTIWQQPQSDGDHIAIEPKAVGDRQFLEDEEAVVGPGFINSDLSAWIAASTTRRINQSKANSPVQQDAAVTPDLQGDPALHMEVQGAWSSPVIPGCEAWFNGQGIALGQVISDWANGDANTNFALNLGFSPDDVATSSESTGDVYAATSGHVSFASAVAQAFAFIGWSFNATGAGLDGYQFSVDLLNLKILSQLAAGLALQGTWPNVGFFARQMIPFIIEGSGLTTKAELLEDDEFVIPQAWFAAPGTRMSKLIEVEKYGLLDGFVFNDRIYQRRFPGTYGRLWRLDSGSAPKSSGPDGGRVWDRITATWQDVDGSTKSAKVQITDPRNAAVAAGRPRQKLLALNGVLNEALATKTAERFLEEAAEVDQSGEATLSGFVQEHTTGVWYPVEYVQPGDRTIEPSTGLIRKITSAPFNDDQASVNATLGAPPEGLGALEDRFDAKLVELGVGS